MEAPKTHIINPIALSLIVLVRGPRALVALREKKNLNDIANVIKPWK